MCGICCYLGEQRDCMEAIYKGIYALQNRGYDSMGVAFLRDKKISVHKKASTDEKPAIDFIKHVCETETDNMGIAIGHARWATCGAKTDRNSHPHNCWRNKFSLVHNGIIENYAEIRQDLITRGGVHFSSETDSEVIVNLISFIHKEDPSLEVEHVIRMALNRLEGTWGIVVMYVDTPDTLYCARHGSPLLIGTGDNCLMVASEQSGFSNFVNNYICLREHDIVSLNRYQENGVMKYAVKKEGHPINENTEVRKITTEEVQLSPSPYPHWTIREINEQPESAFRALGRGGRILDSSTVVLGGLESHSSQLNQITDLILLGCGTSYNAGMYALDCFRRIGGFRTVQLFDAAEFTVACLPYAGRNLADKSSTGLLLLSQSGETKDLHRALEIGREHDLYMIGVVNVVDSLIAREVQCGVYLNAGREVGVASTKSFTSQVIVLHLIAIWFAQYRGIFAQEREKIIEALRALPEDIAETLKTNIPNIPDVPLFVLGKGVAEAVAHECALKIKELSYVFAEAYSLSALKHGPYSCLSESGTPVLVFAPEDEKSNSVAIIDELLCRHAVIAVVTDTPVRFKHFGDKITLITTPKNRYFSPLLGCIVGQLIAYHKAVALKRPVDFPRNIAKSVTVD